MEPSSPFEQPRARRLPGNLTMTKSKTPAPAKKSTASHTPGPWSNDHQGATTGFGCGYGKSQIYAGHGVALAAVAIIKPQNGELYHGESFSKEAFAELEANAALIAAAPEMKAVLEDTLSILGYWQNAPGLPAMTKSQMARACSAIHATLAKASGER